MARVKSEEEKEEEEVEEEEREEDDEEEFIRTKQFLASSSEIVTVYGALSKSFTHECSAPSIDASSLDSGA